MTTGATRTSLGDSREMPLNMVANPVAIFPLIVDPTRPVLAVVMEVPICGR